jgi:hypothetical protein
MEHAQQQTGAPFMSGLGLHYRIIGHRYNLAMRRHAVDLEAARGPQNQENSRRLFAFPIQAINSGRQKSFLLTQHCVE